MAKFLFSLYVIVLINGICAFQQLFSKSNYRDLKEKCPKVKALRNFDLEKMMGFWYVVQYYASSEEAPEYGCMRSILTINEDHVTMNFTYIFEDDPFKEPLQGNLTWIIPNLNVPAHWIHTEDIYEGIYNTYIIDTDYDAWGLIMHCAEKAKSSRYLSALLLSRNPTLGANVINFLRDKLPRYDIDTSFMFDISQIDCDGVDINLLPIGTQETQETQDDDKHPLKPIHLEQNQVF